MHQIHQVCYAASRFHQMHWYVLCLLFCFEHNGSGLLKLGDLLADLALTGDAADELLGGYSFTWGSEDPVWSDKRAQMCSTWSFCAPTIAAAIGDDNVASTGSEAVAGTQQLNVFSPYMHSSFKEWALKHTAKSDCVAEREVCSLSCCFPVYPVICGVLSLGSPLSWR